MNTDIVKPVLTATEPASENFPAQTMSSREIAELTEKRPDNVIRDIKTMIVGLYGSTNDTFELLINDPSRLRHLANSITWEKDSRGYVTTFHLDRSHSYSLVSGYDVKLRKRIIDRWIELEISQRPMSPAEILIAQGTALLAIERQQAAIAAKQEEQDHKIAETERRLNQIETATDYFTVIGYARWAKSMRLDLKTAADVGRHATKRANHLGVKVMKVPDPRFGAVSQYPKEVLDFVWDEVFAPAH